MEKVIVNILYKNGVEDEFEQIVESTEQAKGLLEMLEVVKTSMKEGVSGRITFGDEKTYGTVIRVDEVIRLKTTFIEGDSK